MHMYIDGITEMGEKQLFFHLQLSDVYLDLKYMGEESRVKLIFKIQ